jgi:hypothetical protein
MAVVTVLVAVDVIVDDIDEVKVVLAVVLPEVDSVDEAEDDADVETVVDGVVVSDPVTVED